MHGTIQTNTFVVKKPPKLAAKFFSQPTSGNEPVREWLKLLPRDERQAIGNNINAVQFGWPMGLPLCDHI